MTVYNIALMSDRNFIVGAHVVVASALRRLEQRATVNVHVLIANWRAQDRARLEQTARLAHSNSAIHFHDCDLQRLRTFTSVRGSLMNYALFDFPDRLSGRVLFLDSDLLVCTDLSPLWDMNLGDNVAAAVTWEPLARSSDKKLFADLRIPLEEPHFNCGVLLIDCDMWRKEAFSARCRELRSRYDAILIGGNQPVINAVLHGRIAHMPRKYNTPVHAHRVLSRGQLGEDRVWHLVGRPKPWDPWGRYLHCLGPMFQEELRHTRAPRSYGLVHLGRSVALIVRYLPNYLKCVRGDKSAKSEGS